MAHFFNEKTFAVHINMARQATALDKTDWGAGKIMARTVGITSTATGGKNPILPTITKHLWMTFPIYPAVPFLAETSIIDFRGA